MIEEGKPAALATVIVAGPRATLLFDEAAHAREGGRKRWSSGIAWVLASTPDELIRLLNEASRGEADCAVLLPIVPAGSDEMAMRGEWKAWRLAVAHRAVLGARPVPVYAAVYACLGARGDEPAPSLGVLSEDARPQDRIGLRQAAQALRASSMRHPANANLLRGRFALTVLDWASEAALLAAVEEIANTPPFFLAGLLLVDAGTTVRNPSAWLSWVAARTGLHPRLPPPRRGALALPSLRFGTKHGGGAWSVAGGDAQWPRRLARVGLLAATAVAAVSLLAGIPYWRVHQEIRRLDVAVSRYEAVPADRIFAKCDALLRVEADYAELNRRLAQGGLRAWAHELADAHRARARMASAIAQYRPPRTSLRLDSTATFEPGNARVRRAAVQQMLEPAAILLRANPDLRVRIVGHTDSTGKPQDNQALSLARAQAVRDELVSMSGADPEHFEVVGRAATQPRADNASSSGRAQNRRVEIVLMLPAARFACERIHAVEPALTVADVAVPQTSLPATD